MQFDKTIVYLVFGDPYHLLCLEPFHIAAMKAEYAARRFSTCHFGAEAYMIYVRVISVCFSFSETIYFTRCVTSAQICDAIMSLVITLLQIDFSSTSLAFIKSTHKIF